MHVDDILYSEDLPDDCIETCAASGDVYEAVEFWRQELDFTVDRAKAIKTLEATGGWVDEDLNQWDDERIARTILWLACNDFNEYDPDEDGNSNCGSDIYVLGE